MRKSVWVLLGAVFLVSCSFGRPAEEASGQQMYDQLCARCHGEQLEGRLGPALGAGSAMVGESDEFLRFSILNGRGSMPSFSSYLSDDQVDRIVDYIREAQSSG